MIDKESVKRAIKQMEWEIELCIKEDCISCEDARTLIGLAQMYLNGKLIEVNNEKTI